MAKKNKKSRFDLKPGSGNSHRFGPSEESLPKKKSSSKKK